MAKRARHEADGGPERPAGKAARPGPVYHRLGGELASYLAEVKGQLEVAGPEEGGLLASRVFEEVAGTLANTLHTRHYQHFQGLLPLRIKSETSGLSSSTGHWWCICYQFFSLEEQVVRRHRPGPRHVVVQAKRLL